MSRGAALGLMFMLLLPAAARAESFARPGAPTPVASYAGRVVWSAPLGQPCRELGCSRKYALFTRYQGRVSRVPIRPRRVPFDVDLGPRGRGRTVAAYSRCRVDSVSRLGHDSLPDPTASSGCRLYLYDFHTRRETRLRLFDRAGTSTVLPTIWNRTLAFAAFPDDHRGGAGGVRLLAGSLRSGRLRSLPRGAGSRGAGPVSLDLVKDRLAFVWSSTPSSCSPAASPPRLAPAAAEMRIDRIGERRGILVESICSEDRVYFGRPQLSASADSLTYYFQSGNRYPATPSGQLRKYKIRDGSLFTRAINGEVLATAPIAGDIAVSRLLDPCCAADLSLEMLGPLVPAAPVRDRVHR